MGLTGLGLAATELGSHAPCCKMSTKLARVLLLCDQALLDMRQLTSKVVTLEQCYVGEGVDGHAGTADLSDTEVALIQQVLTLLNPLLEIRWPPGRKRTAACQISYSSSHVQSC